MIREHPFSVVCPHQCLEKRFPTEGQKDNFSFFLRVIVEKECVLEEING